MKNKINSEKEWLNLFKKNYFYVILYIINKGKEKINWVKSKELIFTRTNVAIPTIQKKAIQESAKRLKKLLEKNLIKIVLYGSYARGDYKNFSDIDIFILVNNKKEELSQI